MLRLLVFVAFILGLLWTSTAKAAPIIISGTATYTEFNVNDGTSPNAFSLTFTGTGLQLTSAVLTLPANTVFDVAGSGPGQSPFSAFADTTLPAAGVAISSALSNGDTVLTLTITGFDSGETISYTIDVDNTTGNNAQQREVQGTEFAGASLALTFAEIGFPSNTVTIPATFGSGTATTASASFTGVLEGLGNNDPPAAEVPEPASLALWSLMSVAGLAAWRKRKMAKASA